MDDKFDMLGRRTTSYEGVEFGASHDAQKLIDKINAKGGFGTGRKSASGSGALGGLLDVVLGALLDPTTLEKAQQMKVIKQPSNHEALKAYFSVESEKMRADVLEPVGKRFPSMGFVVEHAKKGVDPVDALKQYDGAVLSLSAFTMMDSLLLSDVDEGAKADPEYKQLKKVVDKAKSLKEKMVTASDTQRTYLYNLTTAINRLAKSESVSVNDVAADVKYHDDVCRLMFPEREHSEAYAKSAREATIDLLEVTRTSLQLAKQLGGGKGTDDLVAMVKKLPTKKAMDAYTDLARKYSAKECDRIYAN
ncbi:hypothetical protein HOK51_03275 [Candidatus Woesearchaeota archaeon]|jgi:hypothetical protein|nr:hypothetical protein [Candidatus Woesearchaeota archaeon]MBT6518841.1 hypothetical protein [Candidatus Woesearchaeota archaeon]MBT7367980.1 hypothetical protein [Candidatus Woesearchaeota archaeon]